MVFAATRQSSCQVDDDAVSASHRIRLLAYIGAATLSVVAFFPSNVFSLRRLCVAAQNGRSFKFYFFLSYTSHLILRFCLTDGVVGFFRLLLPVIFFLYEYFFTPMPRRDSNPRQSEELHHIGTNRTL